LTSVFLGTSDFASFLLQAQNSKAKVIGLANAGGDTVNAVKQAAEFGLQQSGQTMVAFLLFVSFAHWAPAAGSLIVCCIACRELVVYIWPGPRATL